MTGYNTTLLYNSEKIPVIREFKITYKNPFHPPEKLTQGSKKELTENRIAIRNHHRKIKNMMKRARKSIKRFGLTMEQVVESLKNTMFKRLEAEPESYWT